MFNRKAQKLKLQLESDPFYLMNRLKVINAQNLWQITHQFSKGFVVVTVISLNGDDQKNRRYKFDNVFDQDTQQANVYNGLGLNQMVKKVVEVNN